MRLFGTISDALAGGRSIERLCLPVAAWMHFVRRQASRGVMLVDPLADTLAAIGRASNGDDAHDVAAFFALDAVFAGIRNDARFTEALQRAYALLGDGSPATVGRALS